ncbi:perforin-1-like [Siphateles boraxobius]|uniref:perforin-1-like n=1 Tax=Siphateles boraxobius TaxID=180520 RepID=UPI0040647FB9
MAVFYDLRLVSLAVLMLASQLDSASAAVRVFGLRARDLTGNPAGNPPDPYLKVWCGSSSRQQTSYITNNANPIWNTEFYFPNFRANQNLRVEVWDKDLKYDNRLGTCSKLVRNGSFRLNCNMNKITMFYSSEAK